MLKLFITLCASILLTHSALSQEIMDGRPTPQQSKSIPADVHDPEDHPDTATYGQLESIFAHAGFHTEFYDSVQTDSSGTLRKIQFAPTAGVGFSYPLTPSWRFLPEVNWVLPRTTEDSRIIKNIFMVRADFGYELLDWLRLRIGTSLMWLNQHGRGGKTELNNGNSTSTFYYPKENRSSLNNTLDLGTEILFAESWSARLQTYTYALFKEERRQISYTIFLTYYWKQ